MWHSRHHRPFAVLALLLATVLAGAFWVPTLTRHAREEEKHRQLFDAWVRRSESTRDWWDGMPTLIGPWAVPFIVRRLEANNSYWRKVYRAAWPKLPKILQGCMSAPQPFNWEASRDAMVMFQLVCDNSEGTRLLLRELHNSNPEVREAAVGALQGFVGKTLSTSDALKAFLPLLRDENSKAQINAAIEMGSLGAAASNAVPLMIPLLSGNESLPSADENLPTGRVFLRANTALALARRGPPASNAVPQLKNLMAGGDNFQRLAAAFALWRVSSNVSDTLPVFIEEMPRFDRRSGFFSPPPPCWKWGRGPRRPARCWRRREAKGATPSASEPSQRPSRPLTPKRPQRTAVAEAGFGVMAFRSEELARSEFQ